MTFKIIMPTVILVGIIVAMWLMARFARSRLGIGAGTVTPGALKVVGRKQLEPRKSLYVVQIADRYILVGTGEQSVNLIDRISADEFALMSDEVEVASPAKTFRTSPADEAEAGDMDADADAPAIDSPVTPDQLASHLAEQQRFATVGESFSWLLNRAKTNRTAKKSETNTSTK
jgi:flagellar biogenesis protein FliO